MKKLVMFAAGVIFAASPLFAAAESWNGTIADSKCAAKHAKGEHGGTADDSDCVKKCVEGGNKYVFVSSGKTY